MGRGDNPELVKSPVWANFWGTLLPCLLAFGLITGSGLQRIINWTSLVVGVVTNFAVPFLLYCAYIRAVHLMPGAGETERACLSFPEGSAEELASRHVALGCAAFAWPDQRRYSEAPVVARRHMLASFLLALPLLLGCFVSFVMLVSRADQGNSAER